MPPAALSEIGANAVATGLFGVVSKAMINMAGLESELAFYGAYHSNPWNQLIHFVCIPCIWWSICVFLCYVPFLPGAMLGWESVGGHRITWGTLQLLFYAAFYIHLEFFAGILTSFVLLFFHLQASEAVARERAFRVAAGSKRDGRDDGVRKGKRPMSWFRFAFLLHALSWYLQIHPGHKVLEGVKPALLDSLGQALGVAPMFALLEGMWYVGLMPEMRARVLQLVADNRAEMCASGLDATWC